MTKKNTTPSPNLRKRLSLALLSLLITQPLVLTTPAHAERLSTTPSANSAQVDANKQTGTTGENGVTEATTADGGTSVDGETTADETTTETPLTPEEEAFNNSIASERIPSESALSSANQELLSKNAKLEREVNDLETQVNVLVNERSGQLYMYGVATALGSFFAGGLLSWMIFGRQKSW